VLVDGGLLVGDIRHGSAVWSLTDKGRRRLEGARRRGEDVELSESPQHRRWRKAREHAVEHLDEVRRDLVDTLARAQERQNAGEEDATLWAEISLMLRRHSARLCWLLHCIHGWHEPEDEIADMELSERLRALGLMSIDVGGVLL
jgi:hypothetical protein